MELEIDGRKDFFCSRLMLVLFSRSQEPAHDALFFLGFGVYAFVSADLFPFFMEIVKLGISEV